MYRFYTDGEDTKKFMNMLLKQDTFDKFECRGCNITTAANIKIDGRINKDFYEEDPKRYFVLWGEIKPTVFFIIKGKKKPKVFEINLSLSSEACKRLHYNAAACSLKISFENDRAVFTTGTAAKEFNLKEGREIDSLWDEMTAKLFKKIGIAVQKA